MPEDLESLKTDINFIEYAVAKGYAVDRKTARSARLKKGSDIVIVARSRDGHYVYFSPHDDADNGTIIDFVMRRQGLLFKEACQELRSWLGQERPVAMAAPSLHEADHGPSPEHRRRLLARLRHLQIAVESPYLESRAIPREALTDERFRGCVYTDERGNVLFPHEDEAGLCGFEIRGPAYKGFSRGSKALWLSVRRPDDYTIVFTESAIDAISYHLIHRPTNTCYASTAGGWGPGTASEILRAVSTLAEPRTVILGFDNDAEGRRNAEKCRAVIHQTEPKVHRAIPETTAKDWNERLVYFATNRRFQ